VFTAHIDAKRGTPGALDNAAGVVVLLLLAELLEDYAGRLAIELVALNGEDYYAAPGEISYLEHSRGRMDSTLLNVNLDAPGYRQGNTHYSLYGCPDRSPPHPKDVLGARGHRRGRGLVPGGPHGFRAEPRARTGDHLGGLHGNRDHCGSHGLDTPDLVIPAGWRTGAGASDLPLALETLPGS